MCTAISFHSHNHYFGRTLDLEYGYHEQVTITPRNFPLSFRTKPTLEQHHAIIGIAYISEDYPLYYDAVNEKGLGMAGLNFPGFAHYNEPHKEKDNISPFEFIPWILGQCATLEEARILLARINLVNIPFSPALPLSPLHWIIADDSGAITVEATSEGLSVYENPVGVLTNNPPFPYHMTNLVHYMALSPHAPENRFAPHLDLRPFSQGMGAIGLPGDLSSPSRFIRAAFTKENSHCGHTEEEQVRQFFHIMGSVSIVRGNVQLDRDKFEITRYTSCCNTHRGVYYYTTYENSRITAVDLHREKLDGSALISYPLLEEDRFFLQNG